MEADAFFWTLLLSQEGSGLFPDSSSLGCHRDEEEAKCLLLPPSAHVSGNHGLRQRLYFSLLPFASKKEPGPCFFIGSCWQAAIFFLGSPFPPPQTLSSLGASARKGGVPILVRSRPLLAEPGRQVAAWEAGGWKRTLPSGYQAQQRPLGTADGTGSARVQTRKDSTMDGGNRAILPLPPACV